MTLGDDASVLAAKAEKSLKEMNVARTRLICVSIIHLLMGLLVRFRGFITSASGANEGDDFGGTTFDLSYWAIGKASFSIIISLMLCVCRPGRRIRIEVILAVITGTSWLCYFAYVITKLLSRLIDDHQWSPNLTWFWTTVLVGSVMCIVESWVTIVFLRTALVYRLDWLDVQQVSPLEESLLPIGQQPLTSPRLIRKKASDSRRLFGATFDWLYGKLEGLDPEDELEDDDELERKSKKSRDSGEEKSLELPKATVLASMKMIGKLCRKDWPILLTAACALVLAAIGQAFIPYLTGQIITTVASATDQSTLERSTLKLLLAAMITAIFTALRGSLFTVAGATFNVRVRLTLLESLLKQEVAFYDKIKAGALSSRINSDTTTISDQVSLNANVFLRCTVQAVVVLIFMFRTNVELSFATFVTVPVVSMVTIVYGEIVWYVYQEAQKRLANANAVSDAALTTMHNVRAFASEKAELKRYLRKLGHYYTLQARQSFLYAISCIISTCLPNLATGLVLYYGGKLAIDGHIKPGDLVSFMLYQQSLSSSINGIGDVFTGLAGAMGAADKVFELINRQPQETTKGHDKPDNFEGTIEFRDVSFRYPARPDTLVLDKISFKVPPGEIWALVGASGGGKSSVLRLLQRLYDPFEGEILLGGHKLQDLDHEYLHEKLCIVGQEPVLYARSISENIAYGLNEKPSMEKIIEAAKAANAHDFILGFEDGYNTPCGDRGVTLSGGQKQRIAIARALIRSGKILLLDEATSALDADSEAQVQATLDKIMESGKHTCMVVAHRLSTVRNAHRIVCMKDGKIVEVGTHDELAANKDSFYYSLIQKQMTH